MLINVFLWQEEAALKEEQERERRKRAEEKFNEWLEKNNEKSKASPKSPCSPTSKAISDVLSFLNTALIKKKKKPQKNMDAM